MRYRYHLASSVTPLLYRHASPRTRRRKRRRNHHLPLNFGITRERTIVSKCVPRDVAHNGSRCFPPPSSERLLTRRRRRAESPRDRIARGSRSAVVSSHRARKECRETRRGESDRYERRTRTLNFHTRHITREKRA